MHDFPMNVAADFQPEKTLRNHLLLKFNLFSSLLEDGYHLRLKVTGNSMMPFIKTGSLVTLSRTLVSNLCVGDIILCQCDDGALKLHRLIRKKGDMLLTKGDALFAPDAPFRSAAYRGRAICVEGPGSHGIDSQDLDKLFMRGRNYLIARYFYFKFVLIRLYRRLKSLKTSLPPSPPLGFF
jgi:hypothetical protein